MKTYLNFIIAFTLIGSVSFGSASKFFIIVSYNINKLEIIEKFCINKEETTFKCDGKCYLRAELDKVDTEEKENPLSSTETNEEKLNLFNYRFIHSLPTNENSKDEHFCFFSPHKISGYLSTLLRPPQA